MKRYGEEIIINDDLMNTIATYMTDEIREHVHFQLSPCTNEEFLRKYCKLDKDFEDLLQSEFHLEF